MISFVYSYYIPVFMGAHFKNSIVASKMMNDACCKIYVSDVSDANVQRIVLYFVFILYRKENLYACANRARSALFCTSPLSL